MRKFELKFSEQRTCNDLQILKILVQIMNKKQRVKDEHSKRTENNQFFNSK